MKKIITNWKFIYGVSVFVLICMFFGYNYMVQLKPPSDDWSRNVPIKSFSDSEAGAVNAIKTITLPVNDENRFLTLWNKGAEVFYLYTDADGKTTPEESLGRLYSQPGTLKATIENGKIIIYTLESGKFNKYIFDLNNKKLLTETVLDKGVENFQILDQTIIYSTDANIKYIDPSGKIKIIYDTYAKMMDVKKSMDGIYHIALYSRNPGEVYTIKYMSCDIENNKKSIYKIAEASDMGMTSLSMGMDSNQAVIFTVIRDYKMGSTTTTGYTFPLGDPSKISTYYVNINGYDPNPAIINVDNKSTTFLAAIDTPRGLKNMDTNIALIKLNNGKIEDTTLLTKTEELSGNPALFTIGNNSYIRWEDSTAVKKTIQMASTNKDFMTLTRKIRWQELPNILMNTLSGEFFGLAFLLVVAIVIVIPTLVLMMLTMIFAMNWSEKYPNKLINMAMGIQIIPKILLAKWIVLDKPDIQSILPVYLKSPVSLFVIIILAQLSAVYCTKRKFPKSDIQNSFLIQYVFFTLLDIILYGLIFMPYRSI